MTDLVARGQSTDSEGSLPRPDSINLLGSLLTRSGSNASGSLSSQSSIASYSQDDGDQPESLPTPMELRLSQSSRQIACRDIDSDLCQLMGEAAIRDDQYHGCEVIRKVEKTAVSDGESPSPGQHVRARVVFSPMDGSPESSRPILRTGSPSPDDTVFTVLYRSISKDGGKISKPAKEGASAAPGGTGHGGANSKPIIDNVWGMYAENGKLYLLNCKKPEGKSGHMPVKGIKLKTVQLGSVRIGKLTPDMTPDLNIVAYIGEMTTKVVASDPAPQGPNPNETPRVRIRTPPTGEDSVDASKRLSRYNITTKGVGDSVCLVTSDARGFLTLELPEDESDEPRLLAMDEAKLTQRLRSLNRTTSYPSEAKFTPLVNIMIDRGNMAIFFNTLKKRYYIDVDEQETLKVTPVPWDEITSSDDWMKHVFFTTSDHDTGHDFPDAPSDTQNVESSPHAGKLSPKLEFESGKTPKSPGIANSSSSPVEQPALIPYEDTLDEQKKNAIEPFHAEFEDTRRHKQHNMSSDDSGISLGINGCEETATVEDELRGSQVD